MPNVNRLPESNIRVRSFTDQRSQDLPPAKRSAATSAEPKTTRCKPLNSAAAATVSSKIELVQTIKPGIGGGRITPIKPTKRVSNKLVSPQSMKELGSFGAAKSIEKKKENGELASHML